MAGFTRTNGDLQPVVVFDAAVGNGNAVGQTAGWSQYANGTAISGLIDSSTVQPFGPKLNFFTITNANLEPLTQNVGNAVQAIVQTVQQLSTIAIYEYRDAGTDGVLAIGIYDTGSYSVDANGNSQLANTAIASAISALGTVSGVDLAGTTCAAGASFSA